MAGALLARRGHRVLTLEAGTFPRFQIGESLLPRSIDLLDAAGLLPAVQARGYQPKPAAYFARGDERARFAFADVFPGQRTATFQVPRADFDQTLATTARTLGVDVQFNQRVDAVRHTPEAVYVVVTELESERQREVSARFVLDCSGYGRVLPKLFSLERNSTLNPRLALFTWVEGDVRPEGDAAGDIWILCHPEGAWAWVIPFSDGRTSIGLVMTRELYQSVPGCDRDRLFTLLNRDPNFHARLGAATPVLKTMKLEGWSAGVTRLYGDRWALTGNAAEFLDPVFSSGVTLALESASRAAGLVDKTLRGEPVDWEQEYEAVVRKAVGVFKVFVQSWYDGRLQEVLMRAGKAPSIQRAITAILGGYVLDDKNPFVRDPEGTVDALLRLG